MAKRPTKKNNRSEAAKLIAEAKRILELQDKSEAEAYHGVPEANPARLPPRPTQADLDALAAKLVERRRRRLKRG